MSLGLNFSPVQKATSKIRQIKYCYIFSEHKAHTLGIIKIKIKVRKKINSSLF